jgi:hypothetical protein
MDIICKGSKPVVYKSKLNLKFFSASFEDSGVTLTAIFTKLLDDGNAVVYGEYTIYLLFSFINSKNQKEYITKTQCVKFNEVVFCRLPDGAASESLYAQTSFTPRVSSVYESGSGWDINVEGEFDVFIYGDKATLDAHIISLKTSHSNSGTATVICIDKNNISANELLEMDVESIEKISANKQPDNIPEN